jgi:hypothetical protein
MAHSVLAGSDRVRCFCADPLALLPLSLLAARWRTRPRAGRPASSRRARVLFSVGSLRKHDQRDSVYHYSSLPPEKPAKS